MNYYIINKPIKIKRLPAIKDYKDDFSDHIYEVNVEDLLSRDVIKLDSQGIAEFISKKKVLITGADGFIGSHLTEELVKQGHTVKAFAYYNSFNSWGWLDTLPKEIMKEVGIEKSISFHCGRHSFATIGLSLGIPIEVISKLLGHTDIKTTQIYAMVLDELKVKERGKWNN